MTLHVAEQPSTPSRAGVTLQVGQTRQVTRGPSLGLYLLIERDDNVRHMGQTFWQVFVIEAEPADLGERVGMVTDVSEDWLEKHTRGEGAL